MRSLFGPEGDEALSALTRNHPLFGFDFDGTLAPIVSRPNAARVPQALAPLLARLAALAPVAVVSGRSVDDVRPRLGFEPAYLIGSHGAEGAAQSTPAGNAAAFDALRWRLGAAHAALAAAGVQVEDKQHSIALHYRLAADHDAALVAIDQVLGAPDARLRRFGGKCVVNVVTAGAPDKADAMFELVRRARRGGALFVGDDLNDEVVFQRAPPDWVTVHVGLDGSPSAAQFFVDGPASLVPLLRRLLVLLRGLA